jgi:hypothetical protein
MKSTTSEPDLPQDWEQFLHKLEKTNPTAAMKLRTVPPRFVQVDGGKWQLEIDEKNPRPVFVGVSPETLLALLQHCGNVSGRSIELKEDKNQAIALVSDLEPRDALESMLATQMAAVHIAMMRHSRLLAGCETIAQLTVQERVFNKLARTFAAQMEALRKHRNGGQQKVTVEHVTINDGGQAIVGAVSPRGDGSR